MADNNKPEVGLHETISNPKDFAAADEAVQLSHDVDVGRYRPFTKSMIRLYLCVALAYLCGCLNGFDGSLMGGLNAMKTYQHYFHMSVSVPGIPSISKY